MTMTDTAQESLDYPPGTVIGHAARTGVVFTNEALHRQEMFAPVSFRNSDLTRVVLGINHQCCRWRDAGRSRAEVEAAIDWSLVLASTHQQTLTLEEDAAGLFFTATFPLDACVQTADGPVINIHAAIREAITAGGIEVSMYSYGAERRPDAPAGMFIYTRYHLVELSLLLPPYRRGGSPGTWCLPASPEAWRLLAELRGTA